MTHRRTIKSSIGEVALNSVPQQKLVVDDESDPYLQINKKPLPAMPDFLNEFPDSQPVGRMVEIEESEEPKNIANDLPPGAVSRLEVIIGMTRLSKEVEFNKVKFKIGLLKSKDHKEMILSVIGDDLKTNAEQSYSIRKHTLARAILEINGLATNVALGSNKFEDVLNFIDELDEFIVEKLFDEYDKLRKEHIKNIENDLGKTGEEVAETIKKS